MKFDRKETIQRGYRYFQEGRVSALKVLPETQPGHFAYSAKVAGQFGGAYQVEVRLDDRLRLIGGNCTCPAFDSYPGACKHMAATLYELSRHLGGGREFGESLIKMEIGDDEEIWADKSPDLAEGGCPPEDRPPLQPYRVTSNALRICMEDFEKHQWDDESWRQRNGLAGELATKIGSIRLVPFLIWDNNQCRIEITVGEDRQYIVRNLKEFCRSMMMREEVAFGKGLQFRCQVEAFDEESRPLAVFLLQQYRQLAELKKAQSSYSYSDLVENLFADKGRGMILTPQALDQFMEIMEGQQFSFYKKERYVYLGSGSKRGTRFEGKFNITVRLQSGEPLIPVEFTAVDGGMSLKLKVSPFRCVGEEHLYLLFDKESECLWRSGSGYQRKISALLQLFSDSDGEVFIAERDVTRFCANIFAVVRDYLDVSGDVELLESYIPWDMEGQVYLDSPASGVITARAYGDYGVGKMNLYTDQFYISDEETGANQEREIPGDLRRNEAQEGRLRRLLEFYFPAIDVDRGMLYIKDDDDRVYDFLKQGQAELGRRVRLYVTDRYKRLMFPAKNKMAAGVSIDGQLLHVTFDLEGFPAEEMANLLAAYRVRKKYYRLKSGTYLSMEEGEIRDAMQLAAGLQLTREEMKAGRAALPKYRALYIDEMGKKSSNLVLKREESFSSLIRAIRDVNEVDIAVPESLDSVLRDYQKKGYRWLKTMSDLGFGAILADDMGLGKTLEVIALLVAASEELPGGEICLEEQEENKGQGDILALVVCPASLVWNWARELQRFAPQLTPVVIAGTAAERKRQVQQLEKKSAKKRNVAVVITSYDLLKRDVELYKTICFRFHIIDEAQYIKNFATKNAKAVNALQSIHRFALTGTPIENRLSDLWSIFHFLMPGYLGSYMHFRQQYERPVLEERDEVAAELLQNQVRPFILRRLKQKVLKELPEKVESVVYVPLEGEQKKLYMANLAKAKLEVGKEIREGGFETNKLQVLALLTRLRQLCCHPALCYEDYDQGSVKLETCMELIREAINGGHRILLFSQFTSMLSLIEQRLKKEEIGYYLLTGQTPKSERQRLVSHFNEGRIPVFLISLKAGGTGLNLTGADVVIHYDPWWNLAAQNQATDRAYRMGQHNSVQVYKLVAEGTIEEKILHLQENKNNLADAVIMENSALLGGMKEEQLRELFEIKE